VLGVRPISLFFLDFVVIFADFVVKSRQRAGLGCTMGVLIGNVGHAQALRLRHAQFFLSHFYGYFFGVFR
jgi:hypothetical protein